MFTEQFEKYDLPVFENGVRMPEIEISKEQKEKLELKLDCSNLTYLKKITWVKLKEKLNAGLIRQSEKECIERLKFEFSVFEKTGTIDYILLLMDIFLWCDNQKIIRGPGRGSGCGSLTLYILELTKVNPLDHNLNFTRFLSEARTKPKFIDGIMYGDGKAMADFDGDIEYYGRDKCIKRLEDKYKGKTSKILTLQYLTGKMALKDTIKSFLEYSESEALEISSEIEVLFGKVASLKDTLKDNKKISSWAKDNMDAFSIAQKIEGLLRTSGVHASGMLISYYNLDEIIPSQLSANNEVVSGYDMSDVLQMSVKVDVLGLRTLTQLEECCKLTGVKIEEVNVNDPSIYEYYLKDSKCFYGLFQIEEGSTKEATLKIKPRNIKHLSAVVAISRPGAIKYIDSFAKFVETGEKTLVHPKIDEALEETGGIILYQEQITEICKTVYGLPEIDADEIRRCVTGDTMFISKNKGWISINDLLKEGYENDEFLVMDENGKQFWKKIQKIWSTGKQTARYVKTSNGMFVKSNRWHRFLTDSGWKARRHLDPDDYIVCAKSIEYEGEDRISLDLAIVIAGLITEGYFTEKNSAHFTNWDKEIMTMFCDSFYRTFGENTLGFDNLSRVARIRAEQKRYLLNYIYPGKSRIKRLPQVMMGMTRESTARIIGFIFSCEGTVFDTEVSMSSASIRLAQQIQLLLLRFSIRCNLYSKYNKKYERDYYIIDIGEFDDVKKFNSEIGRYICSEKASKLSTLCNNRVIETSYTRDIVPASIVKKFNWQHSYVYNSKSSGQNFTKNTSFRLFRNHALSSQDKHWINFSNGKHEYSKLKSSKELYDRQVELFDFTVDEETPFIIANGIVIHNCIGKKDSQKIAEWEPVLFQKGEDKGIPRKATEWFWSTCNASADYLFNLSHCLDVDTLVETENGFKKMQDIKCGEKIKGFNVLSQKNEFSKVLNIFENEKELYEIELMDGKKIKSSLDHKFMCADFQMRKLKEIIDKNLEIISE